jgi:hypothetical protein
MPKASSAPPTIELHAESVDYYSQKDEDAFFEWLAKIRCVTKIAGSGYILSMTIQLDLVDQDGLRELLAIFHRYGISMSQLAALEQPEWAAWFRSESAYWHAGVFGARK